MIFIVISRLCDESVIYYGILKQIIVINIWILEHKGATTLQKLGAREAIQAKPESGARSAGDLRAEPKSRARPEKKRGGVRRSRGLSESLPRNLLEFRISNRYIWYVWCSFQSHSN